MADRLKQTPKVFEYSNYRLYLKAFYEARKASQPGFSHRVLARMAGFSSPNFLQLVMDGKRNLSSESIEKCLRALKLGSEEAGYFRHLVLLNQSQSAEEKRHHAEKIVSSRSFRKLHPLRQAQFRYFSEWHYVAVRELVALPGFREDPEWIAQALVPAISIAEAKKSLELLLTLGMIRRREEDGKLVQVENLVTTGDEVTMASAFRFHQQMIRKGAESIELIPREERDISGLTLGLSEDGARRIKDLIQKFRKELLALAENETELSRVYQVNFQFFPLTVKSEDV